MEPSYRLAHVCLRVCVCVCVSVGLSVRKVYCEKTADWISMPFQMVKGMTFKDTQGHYNCFY